MIQEIGGGEWGHNAASDLGTRADLLGIHDGDRSLGICDVGLSLGEGCLERGDRRLCAHDHRAPGRWRGRLQRHTGVEGRNGGGESNEDGDTQHSALDEKPDGSGLGRGLGGAQGPEHAARPASWFVGFNHWDTQVTGRLLRYVRRGNPNGVKDLQEGTP